MDTGDTLLVARGLTDDQDRLLSADDTLADLQRRCGGTLPGVLAIPELLDLVSQGRSMGLRLAREFSAYDGEDFVSGFVRVNPLAGESGGGCELLIDNWHRSAPPADSESDIADRLDLIDRTTAEISLRLDRRQQVQVQGMIARDADSLRQAISTDPGKVWTDYVHLKGVAHHQPLHWRLLDGARCEIPGSVREWRARLLPLGCSSEAPQGFELLLVADHPLEEMTTPDVNGQSDDAASHIRLIGSALTPALRQPIARVIANAETIKAKLAGPIRQEYADYANNIAGAGQHLNAMLEDLADLEVVEAPGFTTIQEKVDLADAARRAAGILGVRAQAREITLELPEDDEKLVATGEFRRVLQILINLIGNAIAYSPEGSKVTLVLEHQDPERAAITVADEGPGLDIEQSARIFEKFERLGRESDGGSGLGLYISRRLARVMQGDLVVDNETGEGARFKLSLPRAS